MIPHPAMVAVLVESDVAAETILEHSFLPLIPIVVGERGDGISTAIKNRIALYENVVIFMPTDIDAHAVDRGNLWLPTNTLLMKYPPQYASLHDLSMSDQFGDMLATIWAKSIDNAGRSVSITREFIEIAFNLIVKAEQGLPFSSDDINQLVYPLLHWGDLKSNKHSMSLKESAVKPRELWTWDNLYEWINQFLGEIQDNLTASQAAKDALKRFVRSNEYHVSSTEYMVIFKAHFEREGHLISFREWAEFAVDYEKWSIPRIGPVTNQKLRKALLVYLEKSEASP
jgi:hypothetical protein